MPLPEQDDGSYPSGIISYTRSGKVHQSAGSASAENYDFLDFLGVAQNLGIDFLPVRWQAALEKAGRGGTAEIRQGLVNIETTFVFKQMKKTQSPMKEALYFSALIAEISILGHRAVRHHENIVDIEGVCWDVILDEEKVWPVLVFQKTPYGDLNDFMTFGAGRKLNLNKRLGLLTDIALAVRDLHSAGIVHGDIKPENVLIFPKLLEFPKWKSAGIIRDGIPLERIIPLPKEKGCYVAKVTDFGYSTLFQNEGHSISMPLSQNWTAPEWHEREFLPTEARKMDAYSFGMLCVWLLLYNQDSIADRDFKNDVEAKGTGILDHALKLIGIIQYRDLQQKENLEKLLLLTLAPNPFKRTSDFNEILQLLSPNSPAALAKPLGKLHVPQQNFQVDLSFHQFIDAHFEVRKYVMKCVEEMRGRYCATPNATLELAFCYELGFGTNRDHIKSQLLLSESGMPMKSLEQKIERVKNGMVGMLDFRPTQFSGLDSEGFIPSFNPSEQYRAEKQSVAAELQYRREIQTFACGLGETHRLVQKLRQQLASLLESEGRLKDAENIQLEMIEISRKTSHRIAPNLITDLGRNYWKQGRYTEAEGLARKSVESSKRDLGENHPSIQVNNQLLASILCSQGNFRDAQRIDHESYLMVKKIMGENHPDTIGSLENMALRIAQHGHGNLRKAEQIMRRTLVMWKSVLGEDHPNTLTSMSNLAGVLINQGKYKESKIMYQRAYDLEKRHLGGEHPNTLRSMSNLAWIANRQGQYEESERIQQQALGLTKMSLGNDHPEVLKRMSELAHMRVRLGKYENAEKIYKQIGTECELSAEHLDVLKSMDDLGGAFQAVGKYDEAEQVYRQAIMLKERAFGEGTVHVSDSTHLLGYVLEKQTKYEEAEKTFRQTIAIRNSILGRDHPYTASSICGLANLLQTQNRYAEAEQVAGQTSKLI